MGKQYYVYLHCRPDGEPFYVGKGYGNRSHVFDNSRSKFHKAIVAKHGRENIGIFVFHCATHDEAVADEIAHIAQLRRDGVRICNLTDGGEGAPGYRHTPDGIAKMSAARLGKPPANKGKPCSDETKRKLSEKNRLNVLTPEQHAKLAAAMRARRGQKRDYVREQSAEERRKKSIAMLGRKASPETRARMSEAQRGHTRNRGVKKTPQAVANMAAAQQKRRAAAREARRPGVQLSLWDDKSQ